MFTNACIDDASSQLFSWRYAATVEPYSKNVIPTAAVDLTPQPTSTRIPRLLHNILAELRSYVSASRLAAVSQLYRCFVTLRVILNTSTLRLRHQEVGR